MDNHRALCTIRAEYTFFSSGHRPFPKRNYTLNYKTNHHAFKRFNITWFMISNLRGTKLKTNSRKTTGTSSNMWKLNNEHFSDIWVKEEFPKEVKELKYGMKMRI